jgi:hypothetical protein
VLREVMKVDVDAPVDGSALEAPVSEQPAD